MSDIDFVKEVLAKLEKLKILVEHSLKQLEPVALEVKQAIRNVEKFDIEETKKKEYAAKLVQVRDIVKDFNKFDHETEEFLKNASLKIYEKPGDKLSTDANSEQITPQLYRSIAGRNDGQSDSAYISTDSRLFTEHDCLVAQPSEDINQFPEVVKIHKKIGLTDKTEIGSSDA